MDGRRGSGPRVVEDAGGDPLSRSVRRRSPSHRRTARRRSRPSGSRDRSGPSAWRAGRTGRTSRRLRRATERPGPDGSRRLPCRGTRSSHRRPGSRRAQRSGAPTSATFGSTADPSAARRWRWRHDRLLSGDGRDLGTGGDRTDEVGLTGERHGVDWIHSGVTEPARPPRWATRSAATSGPWAPSATPFSVRTIAASRRSAGLGFTDRGSGLRTEGGDHGDHGPSVRRLAEGPPARDRSMPSVPSLRSTDSPTRGDRDPGEGRSERAPRQAANRPVRSRRSGTPTTKTDGSRRRVRERPCHCGSALRDDRSRPHAVDDDGHRSPALDRTAGVRVEHEVGRAIDHRDLVRERMRRR